MGNVINRLLLAALPIINNLIKVPELYSTNPCKMELGLETDALQI